MDAAGRASVYQHLTGGLIISISSTYARALVSKPRHYVLTALEQAKLSFDIAVAANGRAWVSAADGAPTTVLVSQAIKRAEAMSGPAINEMLAQLRAAVDL